MTDRFFVVSAFVKWCSQKCFDFLHNRHYQHTWDAWVHANFADEAAIRAAWARPKQTIASWSLRRPLLNAIGQCLLTLSRR